MTATLRNGLPLIYALMLAGIMLALALPALAADTADGAEEAGPEAETDVEVPVTIHPYVDVQADYIVLGDLFDPLDRYADRVVARAPQPGSEVVLPAVWLWKVAKTFGVDWKPSSAAETVTVTRPSSLVTPDMVEGLMLDAYFKRTGEDDLIDLEMDGGDRRIHLPLDVAPTVRVDRFDLDPRSGRFTATVVAPAEGRPLHRSNVSGRFHRLVEMPVPTRRLGVEHIIRPGDITFMRLREDGLATNLIVDPERLVGQAVVRALPAGQPVRIGAIRAPLLVHKDRIVTVTLETEAMVLTVQARALEDGAEGDVVRVQNTQSNTMIEAVVTGDGKVRVQLASPIAMQTQ